MGDLLFKADVWIEISASVSHTHEEKKLGNFYTYGLPINKS